jgi:hypothetical protein
MIYLFYTTTRGIAEKKTVDQMADRCGSYGVVFKQNKIIQGGKEYTSISIYLSRHNSSFLEKVTPDY